MCLEKGDRDLESKELMPLKGNKGHEELSREKILKVFQLKIRVTI